MNFFPRKSRLRLGRNQVFWLTLLLLLAVLVPSICLLWFMNQAVRNERLAVRQRLVEAYRGYLAIAQKRLETSWKKSADDPSIQFSESSPRAFFAEQVRGGSADAVVIFDQSGEATYPDRLRPTGREESAPDWITAERLESTDPAAAAQSFAHLAKTAASANAAALALQAQARCLVQAGNKVDALKVLTGPMAVDRFRGATDSQGRLIAPNAQLLALELEGNASASEIQVLRSRLRNQLLDYDTVEIPAPQRRFLMSGLNRLFPDPDLTMMFNAEDLAARYLEANTLRTSEPGLRPSPLPDVWQFTYRNGRVVTLYTAGHLQKRLREAAASPELPRDVRVDFIPPGEEPQNALHSQPMGSLFPGWQLAISVLDPRSFDLASRERITTYVWTGVLVVGLIVVLGTLALGLVRRQAALTQLRNDLVANVTHELKTPLSSMRLLVDTLLDSPQLNEQTVREYLALIANENVRLSRLIGNFLTFSRIERNKYTFDFREVPASALVEGAASVVRKRFDVPGCQFSVQAARTLPVVVADADAMVTALVNLLDNAWKYSGEEKEITLAAEARNGAVQFKVTDNGIGLSSQEAKRVFRRFYRVNRHLSQPSAGCGLGLSIVQFIVSAHEGTVSVESKPARGTTFIVALPVKDRNHSPESKS